MMRFDRGLLRAPACGRADSARPTCCNCDVRKNAACQRARAHASQLWAGKPVLCCWKHVASAGGVLGKSAPWGDGASCAALSEGVYELPAHLPPLCSLLRPSLQPQQPPERPHPSAWQPSAAAAAARPNRTAGLWVGLAAASLVAFAYGAWLTRSVVRLREREPGSELAPALSPQRRQLLQALLADKQAQAARQAREQRPEGGPARAAAATGGGAG